MALATTEQSDARYRSLDLWSTAEIATVIAGVQGEAVRAVGEAAPALAGAIEALTGILKSGGRIAYAGAGSSGLIAQLDAIELPGTFGIDASRLPVILAGGPAALQIMPGGAEDDPSAAAAAVDALEIGPGDALVAVAASGSTPFTLGALRQAGAHGALTVGIACAAGSPLLAESEHPILIATPPEVVAGSTRMAAGTAQKCALNILSTGIAVRLGHAYAGLMVNMKADNAKLRRRAVGIVVAAAEVEPARAERALAETNWSIKTAVLLCLTGLGAGEARARLSNSGGDIRGALRHHRTA